MSWICRDGRALRSARGYSARALLDARPLKAEKAAARILELAGRQDDDVGVVVDWTWTDRA